MEEFNFFQEIFRSCVGWMYIWTLQDRKSYSVKIDEHLSENIENLARRLSGEQKDVYYSIGTVPAPVQPNKRALENDTTSIGCIWVDIDIESGMAHKAKNLPTSIDEAMEVLPPEFPPSIIVHSGHGLHVYWLLKNPIYITNPEIRNKTITMVRKVQQLVRNNANKRGWKIDPTADLARVLRVPSTWNYKDKSNTVPCEIIESSDIRYDSDVFANLQVELPTKHNKPQEGRVFTRNSNDGDSSAMFANCKFLQHCQLDAKDITYDEWMAAFSNLARAKDGVKACHELSAIGHEHYCKEKTENKINEVLENMSPTTCEYIQQVLGFKHCDMCPVKCPSGWALANVPRAIATVRKITKPTAENVFTKEVIGALALLQDKAPLEFNLAKAKFKGHINLNDLNQVIAKSKQKQFRVVKSDGSGNGVKTSRAMISDCPVDVIIPARFSLDETGVYEHKETQMGGVIENMASGMPVVITRKIYNLDTHTEKVELSFKYFNKWRKIAEPRSTVFSSRSIIKLADYGLNVSSETAKYLVRYLQQMEPLNVERIPHNYSVSRLGWRDNFSEFVLPCEEKYLVDLDDDGDITESMQINGTLPDWLNLANKTRAYPFARFLLAASFAAPLLGLLRQRNFMLYFWGTSGGGKTAAMKAALSVWGNPDKLMTSFLTTKAGLERRLSLMSDFPVAINERQVAGQGREKQEYLEYIVYMLEGGKGKGRASKTGLQKTAFWRTIGMANGEEPLTRENSIRGVKNRIIEINTYPVLPDELAREIHQTEHWGIAGREYIHLLTNNNAKAHDIWQDLRIKLTQSYNNYSTMHVDAVSVIAAADVLVSEWLYGLDHVTAVNQAIYMADVIFKSLPTASELSDTARSWSFLQNWLAANSARFDNAINTKGTPSPLYGFVRGNETCIFPQYLRKAMEEEGISYEKSLREWGVEGRIKQSINKDGYVRNLYIKKFNGKVCRVIIINDEL